MDIKMEDEFLCPNYYSRFSCIASLCEDSCCRSGWEIPIDDETYRAYKSMGVSDIDANITAGSDGDRIFKLKPNSDCPYLMPDGLCRLYTITGGKLGEICAQYPRFFEEYDGFTEAGISISCPEAQRLILSAKRSAYALEGELPQEELLSFLHSARKIALDLVFSPDPPDISAARLANYGLALQELIDTGELDYSDFARLPKTIIAMGDELNADPKEEYIFACKAILEATDILYPEWKELLMRGAGGEITAKASAQDGEKRAYLGYLVYRFFLKAVNNENIAAVCELKSCAYYLATMLPGDFKRIARLFSKEIEHDDENLWNVMERFEERADSSFE